MLSKADVPLKDAIAALAGAGIEAGFLVPTPVGLEKSILDAHGELRAYFASGGFHDYEAQMKGPCAKLKCRAWLIDEGGLLPSEASLYRPETKKGDPRIWFKGLKDYAAPWNLLAIFAFDGELFVANLSIPGMMQSARDATTPLGGVIARILAAKQGPADELLGLLRRIASRGYVSSLRQGATGVGMTLETLLGISANSSKAPDFKGIEIKSGREAGNRTTLFSKVPDWAQSKVGSAQVLLQKYGYIGDDGRLRLYCTIGPQPNQQKLFLSVGETELDAMYGDVGMGTKVVQWPLDGLRKTLAEKHRETFWVKAKSRRSISGVEEFQYTSVIHTQAPLVANLAPMLAIGEVQVDFLVRLKSKGTNPGVRDHGYLFKMHQSNLGKLFPPSKQYALC